MKDEIVIKFIKYTVFSALSILLLWLFISYLLLFSGKSANQNAPEYLVSTFEQYIQISDKQIKVSKEGEGILKDENLWLQVLNKEGSVVYEFNVPNQVLKKYTPFQIVYYCANSDVLKGYTIFSSELEDGYGILLGCNSSVVTKMSVKINGHRQSILFKELIIFVVITGIMLSISGYLFAKLIGRPVGLIINGITEVLEGKYHISKRNERIRLYREVFDVLEQLCYKLKEGERERLKLEKMRSEWIASISHDLKTPLSSIKGYTELLLTPEYEFDDEEEQQFLDIIDNSVDYMEELIEELRISQKLKEGTYPLNIRNVDMLVLITECIDEVLGIKEFNRRNIKFDVLQDMIQYPCDIGLMKRCIINLLINAFVHNEEPVEVKVRLEIQEKLNIIISDNGKGIKDEDLPYLFERYFRGGNTEVQGTGLGLAIVKDIIAAHKGIIEVKSVLGVGTKFNIKI